MENKLQALTDKLYQDGLVRGKEEGERLLQEARIQAAEILDKAKSQASGIVEQARQEAEDLRKNSLTEITITSRQMLSRLKQEIEDNLMAGTLDASVRSAMGDKPFVQELLLKALEAFHPEKHAGLSLELLLPEAERASFDEAFRGKLEQLLQNGLEVKFSGDVQGGFKIINKTQGYMLSFTEEDFLALFKEYARPRIKQMLF